ncbi:MAG: aldo/keto reductase [Candidatus Thiodiazotropha sp. 6PDIVS]
MNNHNYQTGRRALLKTIAGVGCSLLIKPGILLATPRRLIEKTIPSSGEKLPVIGMGTSRTFDSSGNESQIQNLGKVLELFFEQGGKLIDSSPMYGSSEQVLGQLLKLIPKQKSLFAATKVWTDGKASGIHQMGISKKLWGVTRFDLMQIHNLRDWQVHLETLMEMKTEGKLRYIGITTSHGRDHDELYQVLEKYPLDFVQLSYNIANPEAEHRLLPLAKERGIAVIANRPFARGNLFKVTKGKALPDWTEAFDCHSWGQFFLKYVVSHPAITCAIPATSKTHHMVDNMGAGYGSLPDTESRQRMARHFKSL